MKHTLTLLFALPAALLLGLYLNHPTRPTAVEDVGPVPDIPRTWDSTAIATFMLPHADTSVTVRPLSEQEYYDLPERVIYKSYSLYAPEHMPAGYFDSLRQLEPEIVFDPATLETEEDWIRAGELIFDAPHNFTTIDSIAENVLFSTVAGDFWSQIDMPLTEEGVMPFWRLVVREKGTVEVGRFACGMCHTRVQDDGTLIKGAQGNYPFDRERALLAPMLLRAQQIPDLDQSVRRFEKLLFGAPWIDHPSQAWLDSLTVEQFVAALSAIPPGVMARHGAHPLHPVRIPDLRGVKDHRYLDATGLMRHRTIGDLMRYAAFNEDAELLTRYNDFIPRLGRHEGPLPPLDALGFDRFTDAQLYALARYLYALEPLPSPRRYDDAMLARGERVFIEDGCVTCHTPPLYTNNELTPVDGFIPPENHFERFDLFDISVETDPSLARYTRRATGYYKVPGLRGLWYRSPLLHDGSVTTLDELFDAQRLEEDFVPSGFKGASVEARAVPGHPFGLELSEEDKAALIAYLNTL